MEGKAGTSWVYVNTSQIQMRIWARLTWGFCPMVEKMVQCQWHFWWWKSSMCLLMSKMSLDWQEHVICGLTVCYPGISLYCHLGDIIYFSLLHLISQCILCHVFLSLCLFFHFAGVYLIVTTWGRMSGR